MLGRTLGFFCTSRKDDERTFGNGDFHVFLPNNSEEKRASHLLLKAPQIFIHIFVYGKKIHNRTTVASEVFDSGNQSLFQVRTKTRLYARLRSLPHLFP